MKDVNPLALLPMIVCEALGKQAELWFLCANVRNKNDNAKLTDSSEVSLGW